MVGNIMKMGNILSDSQSGQYFTGCAIGTISGNCSDDLNPVCFSEKQNGATAHPVDCNTINEVSVSPFLMGADVAREETEGLRGNGREAKPANFSANVDELAHWEKCYRQLWKLKISFEKKE